MRTEKFDVDILAETLQGTCKTIDEALIMIHDGEDTMEEEDLTKVDHSQLDEVIFRCEQCNWWCEACEQDSEGNCSDCSTEEDEDED